MGCLFVCVALGLLFVVLDCDAAGLLDLFSLLLIYGFGFCWLLVCQGFGWLSFVVLCSVVCVGAVFIVLTSVCGWVIVCWFGVLSAWCCLFSVVCY